MGSHTFDSYNAMMDLFGSPPLLVNGTILTLEHVMQRLEIIETDNIDESDDEDSPPRYELRVMLWMKKLLETFFLAMLEMILRNY